MVNNNIVTINKLYFTTTFSVVPSVLVTTFTPLYQGLLGTYTH